MGTFFLVLLALVALAVFWLVGIYNKLVTSRNQVKNAWSQIDVQLQRRYDLIPNLVETVKGYMNFEKGTLEAVISARNQGARAREAIEKSGEPPSSEQMQQILGAEAALRSSIPQIFALAENYPQLRASENMQILQEELASTENRIAFARQAYNDQSMLYNNAQQEFPAVLVASFFGHHPAELYQITSEDAKQPVKVSF
ncbi:MAG TPA: LemA family protein [Parachlamydiaceae bacterium]|nr:LemA family protein [Parachlamydiaceae bacterium]